MMNFLRQPERIQLTLAIDERSDHTHHRPLTRKGHIDSCESNHRILQEIRMKSEIDGLSSEQVKQESILAESEDKLRIS